jgi:class 3 adenylate cyclase/predicted ATPase
MSRVCSACGASNDAIAKFCNQCGAPLPRAAEPAPASQAVERRRMSVMFTDLVGSTELSLQLDPEDLRDVIQAYRETCRAAIERHEGVVGQYIGDGIVAYFGYPVAHEDDARRAARTGLDIVQAIRALRDRLVAERGIPVSVRVAIHTGLTVVGDIGGAAGTERLALGDTPNIAARLQALAEPDTVVVSGATQRLIAGFFTTTAKGRHQLKGLAEPVEMYRVDALSRARHRLEAAATHHLTPYVGRADAVAALAAAWQAAQTGAGSVELLVGDPGVGKSRLLATLREAIAATPYDDLDCYCSPYYSSSALYPIVEALRAKLGLDDLDGAQQLARVREALRTAGDDAQVVTLIAQLLGIAPEAGYQPPALHPLAHKHKTADALLALLTAPAVARPVLLVIEDLHWADPTTVEFLGSLLDQAPAKRLLVLLTARPEFRAPWDAGKRIDVLHVKQLSPQETAALARGAADGKQLPDDVVALLVAMSDGNPLYVEEMTRMLLDSPLLRETEQGYALTGPLPDVLVPATLQELLTARLDGMAADAKKVIQVAAVIGREFTFELVREALAGEEAAVRRGLARLIDEELVFETPAGYVIKHALIQDAAYDSLLRRTRAQLHERIVRALEARMNDPHARVPPERLAAHWIKAGQPPRAIPYCLQAGQRAVASSANAEAANHLRLGLQLLAGQPASAERDRTELAFLATLGTALTMQKGWAAPEVAETYSRAQSLSERVGDTPHLFWVLWGMWAFYLVKGDQHTALEEAQRLRDAAHGDPVLAVEADFSLGLTHYYRGNLHEARVHLESAVAAYVPEAHHANASLSCQDVGVTARSVAAMVLYLLGEPELSLARSREAIALAERLQHPFSHAYALGCAAWLHAYRREPDAMAERARELTALTRAQALDWWLIWGTIFEGRSLIDRGEAREGAARMEEALALYRAVGTGMVVPYFLLLLAEGDAASGDVAAALGRIAQARDVMAAGGETFPAAEADRLEAELRLQRWHAHGHADELRAIEGLYRRAVEIARSQRAQAFEQRAAAGLANLLAQPSRAASGAG